MYTIMTTSPEELVAFGKNLGFVVNSGDFIALDGDLGAGKTLTSTGIASALGVTDDITSPTFTIIHEYESGRIPFYHMDVYRIKNYEEMYDLGYEEYFYGNGVTVVEWAELIEPILPDEYLQIVIRVVPEGRSLEITPHGSHYEELITQVLKGDL